MQVRQEINESVLYQYISNVPPSLVSAEIEELFPVPEQDAIDSGVMMRYFIRQINHRTGYITEIDKSTYNKFRSNKLYKVIEIPWRIAGALDDVMGPRDGNTPTRLYTGVKTSNEMTLKAAESEMSGITRQLGNPVQFWIGR